MSTVHPNIRQTHQPRKHKLVRIQNTKHTIEHLHIVCIGDGRSWRRRRGAMPSTGVAVVDDRRSGGPAPFGPRIVARGARKDRFVIRLWP